MTPEQAIKILDSDTSLVAIEELKYYAGFNRDKVIDQIQEAMDMGAEALRKQTAKEPVHEGRRYLCPACMNPILYDDEIPNEYDSYCPVCGQKIDWEGIEE